MSKNDEPQGGTEPRRRGRPKVADETHLLQVTLPTETMEWLKRQADANEESVASTVRAILDLTRALGERVNRTGIPIDDDTRKKIEHRLRDTQA